LFPLLAIVADEEISKDCQELPSILAANVPEAALPPLPPSSSLEHDDNDTNDIVITNNINCFKVLIVLIVLELIHSKIAT
jgi:hypothetical protein